MDLKNTLLSLVGRRLIVGGFFMVVGTHLVATLNQGALISMSRKGNAYDNSPIESFFATLKSELVHRRRYRTRAEARADIFDYIETFYNRRRRHSTLGYLSPLEFERRHGYP